MSSVAVSEQDAYGAVFDSLSPAMDRVNKVYDLAASALEGAGKLYHGALKVSHFVAEKLTDNALGRVSGAAYYAKSVHAMMGAGKDVDVRHLTDILKDPMKPLGRKIVDTVKHVADKFSHESTVGAAAFFGKHSIIAPAAVGVAALVGMALPAAASVAGMVAIAGVADVAMTKAATYFLATHAGHGVESGAAGKIEKGKNWLKGLIRAAHGHDPEYKMMAEIGDKLEAGAKAHDHKHEGHKHGGHGHDHGHHHHESFWKTLGKDLSTIVSVHKWPEKISHAAKEIAHGAVNLYNHVLHKEAALEHGHGGHDAKAPASKFGALPAAPEASVHEPEKPAAPESRKPSSSGKPNNLGM